MPPTGRIRAANCGGVRPTNVGRGSMRDAAGLAGHTPLKVANSGKPRHSSRRMCSGRRGGSRPRTCAESVVRGVPEHPPLTASDLCWVHAGIRRFRSNSERRQLIALPRFASHGWLHSRRPAEAPVDAPTRFAALMSELNEPWCSIAWTCRSRDSKSSSGSAHQVVGAAAAVDLQRQFVAQLPYEETVDAYVNDRRN